LLDNDSTRTPISLMNFVWSYVSTNCSSFL
jgi:hypothetical protein